MYSKPHWSHLLHWLDLTLPWKRLRFTCRELQLDAILKRNRMESTLLRENAAILTKWEKGKRVILANQVKKDVLWKAKQNRKTGEKAKDNNNSNNDSNEQQDHQQQQQQQLQQQQKPTATATRTTTTTTATTATPVNNNSSGNKSTVAAITTAAPGTTTTTIVAATSKQ